MTTIALAQAGRTPGNTPQSMVKMVRFYPNPASTFINFEFKQDVPLNDYTFKIFSFIGKKVMELNNISPRTQVNLSDYFRGVYIFQLTDRNGRIIESGKFQVVK
jgi:hypothetical protein